MYLFNNEIGPQDVLAGKGEEKLGYKNLRKALCVGYASQLAERKMHHNGYRTLGFKAQVVQVLIFISLDSVTVTHVSVAFIDHLFHVSCGLILFLL